jgi:hypothetical protein
MKASMEKWFFMASNVHKQYEGIDGYKVLLHGILRTEAE